MHDSVNYGSTMIYEGDLELNLVQVCKKWWGWTFHKLFRTSNQGILPGKIWPDNC